MSTMILGGKPDKRNSYRIFERVFIFICFLGYTFGIWFYWRGYYDIPGAAEYASAINAGVPNGYADALIRISFPSDNYLISSALTPDMIYSWENPYSYTVKFQISSSADFSGGIMAEETLTGAAIQGRFLPPGTYYWRVSPVMLQAASGIHPNRLVVLPSFGSPEIVTPGEGDNLKITEGIPVDFRWEKLNYADTYEFKLYSNGGKIPVYEISSLADTVVQAYFSPRTAGNYRWTVQATMESRGGLARKRGLIADHYFSIGPRGAAPVLGFVRGVVKSGAIHTPITLLIPREGDALTLMQGTASQTSPQMMRWSADDRFINTRVLFSRDQDPALDPGAIVQNVDEGETSISIPALSEGVWYWIVQGETPGGQSFSAASPSWFSVQPLPPFDAPVYLQPADETVINLERLTRDRNITFSWEEVPGSNAYIFTLFDAGNKKPLYSSFPNSDTSFILTDLAILTADDYTWQVEAVSVARNGSIERRGIIQQSSFSVDIQRSENLRAISQGTTYGY